MSNEYKINKLIDILKIPEDRVDDFLVELKIWIDMSRSTIELLNVCADTIGEKLPPMETGMNWVDDGLKNVSIKLQATHSKDSTSA